MLLFNHFSLRHQVRRLDYGRVLNSLVSTRNKPVSFHRAQLPFSPGRPGNTATAREAFPSHFTLTSPFVRMRNFECISNKAVAMGRRLNFILLLRFSVSRPSTFPERVYSPYRLAYDCHIKASQSVGLPRNVPLPLASVSARGTPRFDGIISLFHAPYTRQCYICARKITRRGSSLRRRCAIDRIFIRFNEPTSRPYRHPS